MKMCIARLAGKRRGALFAAVCVARALARNAVSDKPKALRGGQAFR